MKNKNTTISNRHGFFKKVVSFLLAVFLLIPVLNLPVNDAEAAGSSNFNSIDSSNRLFSEWSNLATAGLKRQQKIFVYAFKGETMYFGSSCNNSKLEITGQKVMSYTTGCDITVTGPNGSIVPFDVNGDVSSTGLTEYITKGGINYESGDGYISSRTQEKTGPQYSYNGTTYNQGGYKPLSFVAPWEGIYEFHFHSSSGDASNSNPTPTKNTALGVPNIANVSAWDVTVVKPLYDSDDEQTGIQEVTGRTFTTYLSLNVGKNNFKVDSTVYVLTNDGYVYEVFFDNIDPFGFILFSNNRGLIETGKNGSSIYHSVGSGDAQMADLQSIYKTTYHSPDSYDSQIDYTYKIFFEKPSEDLEGILFQEARIPSSVTDFRFFGVEDGVAYYKHGGYFTFDVTNATSAKITIDLTNLTDEETGTTYNGGTVVIDRAVVEGENTFYWDGKDSMGNYVDIGKYNLGSNGINVRVSTKAGEIHFPFLDVEACGSIQITLISEIHDALGNVVAVDDVSRRKIHYNNRPLTAGVINDGETANPIRISNTIAAYDLGDGTYSFAGTNLTSGLKTFGNHVGVIDATQGVDSARTDVVSFAYNASKLPSGGNNAAVDVWTYYCDNSYTELITMDSDIEIIPDTNVATINGFVFYDTNSNGAYSNEDNDFSIQGEKVDLYRCDSDTDVFISSTTSNSFGLYNFHNVSYDLADGTTFKIKATPTDGSYSCITKNETQTFTLNSQNVLEDNSFIYEVQDIGYHYTMYGKKIQVEKQWDSDITDIPDSIIVELWMKYMREDGEYVTKNSGRSLTLSNLNEWGDEFENLPKHTHDDESGEVYEVSYFVKEHYYNDDVGEFVQSGVSKCDENDYDPNYENTVDSESEYIASFRYGDISSTVEIIYIKNTAKHKTGTINIDIDFFDLTGTQTKDSFYAGLFTRDKFGDYTLQGSLKMLNITGSKEGTKATATINNIPFGTYYVFQTDDMCNIIEEGNLEYKYKIEYITKNPIVLSESSTNFTESASINDYKYNEVSWNKAHINYQFYLVNSEGNPVDYKGNVVSFEKRTTVTAEQTLTFTDKSTTLLASNYVPKEYTLYNPDASYVVNIGSSINRGNVFIKDSLKVPTTKLYYPTAAVQAPDGFVKDIDDYTNTSVAFAVLLEKKLLPDTVVIDYGLPIEIHVLDNDLIDRTSGTITAIGDTLDSSFLNTVANKESKFKSGNHGNSINLDCGNAEIRGNTIKYTPNPLTHSKEDILYYEFRDAAGVYYYSSVTVIPATTMYYEDGVVTYSTNPAWYVAGNTTANALQDEDRVGNNNTNDIDANNVYGYDSAYSECSTYSLGSAHYVDVSNSDSPSNGGMGWPTATFTFAGTGFDLISLTSNTTGTVRVQVFNGTTATGTSAYSWIVDTYYSADDILYQVPIIKSSIMEYGTYTVKITPMYSHAFDHADKGSYRFYLDAIRIYDPVNPDALPVNVENAYIADNEYNPEYQELRNILISSNSFDATGEYVTGAVFIDGNAAVYNSDITEYVKEGPNNEVYLQNGQAVAFYIRSAEIPQSLQIGAKALNGNSAAINVGMCSSTFDEISIATATGMYYDIFDQLEWEFVDGSYQTLMPIMISNTTPNSMVSLTDIKWTYAKTGNPPHSGVENPRVSLVVKRSTPETIYKEIKRLSSDAVTFYWFNGSNTVSEVFLNSAKISANVLSSMKNGIPEREGYIFAGWYRDKRVLMDVIDETNASKYVAYTLGDVLSKGEIAYAGWVKENTVRLEAGDKNRVCNNDSLDCDGFELLGVQLKQTRKTNALQYVTRISHSIVASLEALDSNPANKSVSYGYLAILKKNIKTELSKDSTATNLIDVKSNKLLYSGQAYDTYSLYIDRISEPEFDIAVRPYILYTDANGTQRYHYYTETGKHNAGGGYYTSLKTVAEYIVYYDAGCLYGTALYSTAHDILSELGIITE